MRKNTQGLLGGGLIGLLVAGTFALPGILPPAMAQDEPVRTLLKSSNEVFARPLQASAFVKPEWTVEPWVSEEIQSQTTVKKIGYGRTSYVSIMTTPTGTYSSDGLASAHVRYPGIVRNSGAGSFVVIVPGDGGVAIFGANGDCEITDSRIVC